MLKPERQNWRVVENKHFGRWGLSHFCRVSKTLVTGRYGYSLLWVAFTPPLQHGVRMLQKALRNQCSTSEPGAVATGQILSLVLFVLANSSFVNLTLWPVATAPGSDLVWPLSDKEKIPNLRAGFFRKRLVFPL